MSKELESKVWASALESKLKPVAAFLADIANADGTAIYPSIAYIAWAVGSHDCAATAPNERTVSRHIEELNELKVLTHVGWRRHDAVIDSTNPRDKAPGKGATAEYFLDEEALPTRRAWKDRYAEAKGDNLSPLPRKGDISDPERVTSEQGKGDNALGDNALGDKNHPQPVDPDPSTDPPYESVAPAPAAREPEMGGDLFAFQRALDSRILGLTVRKLVAVAPTVKDDHVVLTVTDVQLRRQLAPEITDGDALRKAITMCAVAGGFRGFLLAS